jgi:uncharacterized membrane protein YoaK (UPF0700 family)
MPTAFLGRLTGRERTRRTNRQLGGILAFVAGAVNAGGFLAIGRYTSHLTGVLSAIADDLVLGQAMLVIGGFAMLGSFLLGAMTTAVLANFARRHELHGEYALPLTLEAGLLLVFGFMGADPGSRQEMSVTAAVLLLCFVMGLQNAVITKVSKAEIRTTHMTGIVTDLGIELGRLVYPNLDAHRNTRHFVQADRDKLGIHAAVLGLFVAGGIAGALAFRHLGFVATVPVAALLMLMAAPPLLRDFSAFMHRVVN